MQQVNNNSYDVLALLSRISQNEMPLPGQGKTESSFDKLLENQTKVPQKQEHKNPQNSEKPAEKLPAEEGAPSTEAGKPQKEEDLQQTTLTTWAMMAMAQAPVVPMPEEGLTVTTPETAVVLEPGTVVENPALSTQNASVGQETSLPLAQGEAQTAAGKAAVSSETLPTEQKETAVQEAPVAEINTTEHTAQQKPQAETDSQAGKENLPSDQKVEIQEEGAQASHSVFSHVESVPVKVSDVSAPENTKDTPDVETQVFKGLTDAVKQGESRVTLQLAPDHLGKVTVELTRGTDGALHVMLSAERLQTQGLLEKHMSGLQTLLANNGQETVQVEVQRQQEAPAYSENSYDGSSGNGKGGYQQQEQDQHQQRQSSDFLQQLRLGLVPLDVTTE